MIPEYMEPKGLAPDAPALEARWAEVSAYNDAILGSRRLRDAILFAQGIIPPDDPQPEVIKLVTKPPKPKRIMPTREGAHEPCRCPTCGSPLQPKRMMIAHIQTAVAAYYGLEPITMKSARRSFEISHPRQVAMYLCSVLTDKSLVEIGRRFGGRDHTTVLYAIRAVEKRMREDDELAVDVAALREALEG